MRFIFISISCTCIVAGRGVPPGMPPPGFPMPPMGMPPPGFGSFLVYIYLPACIKNIVFQSIKWCEQFIYVLRNNIFCYLF